VQEGVVTLLISMHLRRLADELLDSPLAEAQPRTIKVGKTFQARAHGSKQAPVPCIRLAGHWLAEAGFDEGDTVQVSVSSGEIRLSRISPPRRSTLAQGEFF